MEDKLVTICIPLYNCENTISKTLDSLLNQTYQNIVIKIFDNQSTDRSGEIAKSYADNYESISYIRNKENVGAEENFTKCIANAEGDYTGIFHSDDIYSPTIIEEQVAAFLKNNVNCVACHANEIDEEGNIIGSRMIPSELRGKLNIIKKNKLRSLVFKYANFITCPSVLVKSDVYRDKIQYWNIREFGTSADLDVWLRLNKLGDMAFISKPLMGYRLALQSYSFRIAKSRITRHDIFKVLYKEIDLSKEEKSDLDFLELKDNTLRSINILRSNSYNADFPKLEISIFSLLGKSFQSFWHFRIFAISVVVQSTKPLLFKNLRKLLGSIRG